MYNKVQDGMFVMSNVRNKKREKKYINLLAFKGLLKIQ